ncbi:MAG: Omega-amino acid--pyruvate aminotransferase, partial [uncultured Rubrobacteraceae bacterium]
HGAGEALGERARPGGPLRGGAREDGLGAPHRQGGSGDGLLLGGRDQGRVARRHPDSRQGLPRILQGRAAPEPLEARLDLPVRRQGGPGDPVLPGAHLRPRDPEPHSGDHGPGPVRAGGGDRPPEKAGL